MEKIETEVHRKDYKPPNYLVDTVDLAFILGEDSTTVHSKITLRPNPQAPAGAAPPIRLHKGTHMGVKSVTLDGTPVSPSDLQLSDKELSLPAPPSLSSAAAHGSFTLEIECVIRPQENKALEGLYKSSGNFCTQCEAEGFRNITPFFDRPDVMARYTTRIEADKARYPILLSNGNLVEHGDLPDGRHFTIWQDPIPKPCYLFAIVAGVFGVREDAFVTKSGRRVALRIYSSPSDVGKTEFAMESLKKAMKWDEDRFGYEYGLDLFNVVAVDDFTMGAMENKSLNIFNSKRVLVSPSTATDAEFALTQKTIGHEYFHDYTGNLITCKDWFQLTLKEGLTRYRDQEFASEMRSWAVKRVEDVSTLRSSQFSQDAGPMAHPIRPESYVKMDNFYTVTVYEKGAEVVRLYETLLGKEGFRRGMDLYKERHAGQAVTCDDFRACMADANSVDLTTLGRWYGQAGTPHLDVSTSYDSDAKSYTVSLRQHTPPTPGQDQKLPVLIPVRMGLLGPDGSPVPLCLSGKDLGTETVLPFDTESASYVFEGVPSRPVPSLLRGFSAPVKLTVEGQTDDDLLFIFAHDTDPINRWDAGQALAKKLLLSLYAAAGDASIGQELDRALEAAGGVSPALLSAFRAVATDPSLDGAYAARALSLPSGAEIMDALAQADPLRVYGVRTFVRKQLAKSLEAEFWDMLRRNDDPAGTAFEFTSSAAGRRAARGKALSYLSLLGTPQALQECYSRFKTATNMTDEMAALSVLSDCPCEERERALSEFYDKWKTDALVSLKWLALHAGSNVPGTTERVRALMSHPAFVPSNPNSCYALLAGFVGCVTGFHDPDGSGYRFMADAALQIDKIVPQVAGRLVGPFTRYKKYDSGRQGLIRRELERIAAEPGLSENVREVVSKSLSS